MQVITPQHQRAKMRQQLPLVHLFSNIILMKQVGMVAQTKLSTVHLLPHTVLAMQALQVMVLSAMPQT
jgi:hypothetical protein